MTSRIIIAGLVALAFVTGYIMTMSVAYAATQGQPFQALDSRITALEEDNVQSDSFFDVFTELGLTPDNFFNVFDILQRAIGDPDFDLLKNGRTDFAIGDPDFDLLRNEVPDLGNEAAVRAVADTRLQSNIDAETASRVAADSQLQTRVFGFCPPGSSIRQVNPDGSVSCESDDVGTGSSGRLIVVQRSGPITEFSTGSPFRSSFALCLSGEMVIGGGYRASPATVNISSESMESAGGGISGWFVNAYSASETGSITALAECATIAP